MSYQHHCALSTLRRAKRSSGFSLLELMIAMAVFVIIGGAAMTLFRQNTNLFTDQQGTTALNINLRNALTQIQNDVVNAANGYNAISPTAGWPFGITAVNVNPGYDTLNVLVPAMGASTVPVATCVLTNNGFAAVTPPAGATAASYPLNTELLFLNTTGNQFTTSRLTGAAAGAGGLVNLTYTPTDTNGIFATDPLKISNQAMPLNSTDQLSNQFCAGSAIVPLNQTTYTVNAATNSLTRLQAGAATPDVIADQIIGFKVGVSQFNNASISSGAYSYDSTTTLSRAIRSVRVSVIGRTPPNQWSGTKFANSFDGGNYKIEALSLVINPRNLSMNDCGSCN
ncbi:MAG TPA: prepilin-type N-terminal cleavage/methylation domain-containing protein [Candidatus Eisenbacteria bacterium]|jgi:prepilin-type N-terminal cleavage/methylation domain-containing protein|nr:prepilin-type N-terminal cleavage/methylation domain-containing protein [Candidatus Eisenbacteria bacterium]